MQVVIAGQSYEFPTVWDIVRDIRKRTEKQLASLPAELRDATALTVTELAENLAKYADNSDESGSHLELNIIGNRIHVYSENRVDSDERATRVLTALERIASHTDPTELYAEAIRNAFTLGAGESQQGFYRIAAVGGFSLTAKYEPQRRLKIFAERNMRP
jgi:hypothetical protein